MEHSFQHFLIAEYNFLCFLDENMYNNNFRRTSTGPGDLEVFSVGLEISALPRYNTNKNTILGSIQNINRFKGRGIAQSIERLLTVWQVQGKTKKRKKTKKPHQYQNTSVMYNILQYFIVTSHWI